MTSRLHTYDTRKHLPTQLGKQLGLYVYSVGWFVCSSHYHVKRASYPGFQCLYVIRGSGWVMSQDEQVDATANDIILMDLGLPHEYGANPADPWEILWVQFDGSSAMAYCSLLEAETTPIYRAHEDVDLRLFRRLFRLFSELPANVEAEAASVLTRILTRLLSVRIEQGSMSLGDKEPSYPDTVRRAIACMQANLSEPLTLQAIAQATSLSAYHLAHMFKRTTGQPVMQYLTQLRLDRAKELIAHTQLSIREVCEQVGFTDQSYFGKLFKRLEGMTPSDYRRRSQAANNG